MSLSEKQLDILIAAGQILFFLGSLIFAGYALDTQQEIMELNSELDNASCVPEQFQSFETNTSNKESSSIPKDLTAFRGT